MPLLLLSLMPIVAARFLIRAEQVTHAKVAFKMGFAWTVLSFGMIVWAIS
ncbi:hypothetical protein JW964_00115 [candidate division KSB1 bacterium]|nr:hypothetical protein [candidate division KSB1 bacterium]